MQVDLKRPILNVKLLGLECAKYRALKSRLLKVAIESNMAINIQELTTVKDFLNYGISGTPAVIINDTIIWEKIVPAKDAVREVLTGFYADIEL